MFLAENDEGGADILLFAATDGLTAGGDLMVGIAMLFLLLGTMVFTPLVVLLLRDTIESARGLTPLDDVPAVVERDVDLDTRDGVSDGALEGGLAAGILGRRTGYKMISERR